MKLSLGIEKNANLPIREMLLNYLPSKITGYHDRNFEGLDFQTPEKILNEKHKYIRFNTKTATSLLVFDLDKFPDFDFRKPSIREIEDYFFQQIGLLPTWIVETEKGYHIALALSLPIFTFWRKSLELNNRYLIMREIKKEITKILHADASGSHRTYGIWRNPLEHRRKYNPNTIYSLDQLTMILEIDAAEILRKQRKSTIKIGKKKNLKIGKDTWIQNVIDAGWYDGNRNNFCFAYAYKRLFEKRDIDMEIVYQELLAINDSHSCRLKERHIRQNVESAILKKETMYDGRERKKYERGKLSDEMWEKNIHGLKNRRRYAAQHATSAVVKKNQEKIISGLKKVGRNISQLCEITNLSKKTILKYLKNSQIMVSWFKTTFLRVSPVPTIDIRPHFHQTASVFIPSRFTPFFRLAESSLYPTEMFPPPD